MRFAIQLAYDGTEFHGWQKQDNANTVQGLLEEKLSLICGEDIITTGCGRTDTGVHARQYFAHFDTAINLPENIVHRLNLMLPPSIAIQKIQAVKDQFHARFDASDRTYFYYIHKFPNPFIDKFSWHNSGELDIPKMNNACQMIIGTHSFASFCKGEPPNGNYACTVTFAQWSEIGDSIVFRITANRFLRNMVRALVGTMLDIGKGKISLSNFQGIFESANRSNAGLSVPAKGLFLEKINYPKEMSISD